MKNLTELIERPSLLLCRALIADAVVSGVTGTLMVLGADLVRSTRHRTPFVGEMLGTAQ
jgi:hypothetical protein